MFISSNEYRSEVEKILRAGKNLNIAVAFWGKGSEAELLATNVETRIICNLSSGGTNPDPIEKLWKRKGNLHVKHLPSLHAKVFLNENTAIVGSANYSTDGLNHESAENEGWEEAALKTTDFKELVVIESWFESMWNKAVEIERVDIDNAAEQWRKRRRERVVVGKKSGRPLHSISLLDFVEAELRGRGIYFAIYRYQTPSKQAERLYESTLISLKANRQSGTSVEKLEYFDGYDEFPYGACLISTYIGIRGAVRIDGVYKGISELDQPYKIRGGEESWIRYVVKGKMINGCPFNEQIKKALAEYVATIKEKLVEKTGGGGIISMSEVFSLSSWDDFFKHRPPSI